MEEYHSQEEKMMKDFGWSWDKGEDKIILAILDNI